MVLGMNLETFTMIHVLISLVGIVSGLIVLYGFLTNRRLDAWTAVFLLTTALTSLTGFLFPFTAVTPVHQVGNYLTRTARNCDRHTLRPAPHLEEDLRYCGLHRIVFQRFRSRRAVV